jgi:hypothetical protein
VAEEGGELAEDKCPVAACGHVLDLLEQRVDLVAREVAMGAVDKRGVQAQLAQQATSGRRHRRRRLDQNPLATRRDRKKVRSISE